MLKCRYGPRFGIEESPHLLPELGIAGPKRRILEVANVLAVVSARPEIGPPPQDTQAKPGDAVNVAQEA